MLHFLREWSAYGRIRQQLFWCLYWWNYWSIYFSIISIRGNRAIFKWIQDVPVWLAPSEVSSILLEDDLPAPRLSPCATIIQTKSTESITVLSEGRWNLKRILEQRTMESVRIRTVKIKNLWKESICKMKGLILSSEKLSQDAAIVKCFKPIRPEFLLRISLSNECSTIIA